MSTSHDPLPKRCPYCECPWESPSGERHHDHNPFCQFEYHALRVTNALIPAGLRLPDNIAFKDALEDMMAWAIERATRPTEGGERR